MIIIADASPIIALVAIGELELLRELYDEIVITPIVRSEIHAKLPDWIKLDDSYKMSDFNMLSVALDQGEASAIALTLAYPNAALLIDEKRGRKAASTLDLVIIGTLGIILKAKRAGLLLSGKLL